MDVVRAPAGGDVKRLERRGLLGRGGIDHDHHWPIYRLALSFCPQDFTLASNIAIRFAASTVSIVPALILAYLLYGLVELPGIDLGKTVVKWIRRQNAPDGSLT